MKITGYGEYRINTRKKRGQNMYDDKFDIYINPKIIIAVIVAVLLLMAIVELGYSELKISLSNKMTVEYQVVDKQRNFGRNSALRYALVVKVDDADQNVIVGEIDYNNVDIGNTEKFTIWVNKKSKKINKIEFGIH